MKIAFPLALLELCVFQAGRASQLLLLVTLGSGRWLRHRLLKRVEEVKQESKQTRIKCEKGVGDKLKRALSEGESWRLLTDFGIVLEESQGSLWGWKGFYSLFIVLTVIRSYCGPYLSSCCKLWSVEGQQYWWRLPKLWTVRLVGNRAAKAALLAAVGVVGAEMGCPETNGGRTLTGRARDGRHTHKHTDIKEAKRHRHIKVSNKAGRESIWSCTLTERNRGAAMIVEGMAHLKGEKRCRCVTICTDTNSSKVISSCPHKQNRFRCELTPDSYSRLLAVGRVKY